MNRTVKWIVGIVLGLIALCALAVVGFVAFNRLGFGTMVVRQRAFPNFEGRPDIPMAPYQGTPYRHFSSFYPLGFFGGWLIFAALLGLFVLAVIALIVILRRPSRAAYQPAAPNQPAAPLQSAITEQPSSSEVTPPAVSPEHSCPSCGRAVQADWSHCPYCGTGLSSAA